MFRTVNKMLCIFDNKTLSTFYIKKVDFEANLTNRTTLIKTLKQYEDKLYQRKIIPFESPLHDCLAEIQKYNNTCLKKNPFYYERFTIDWEETRRLNTK